MNYSIELMTQGNLPDIELFLESEQWNKQELLDAIANPFNVCIVAVTNNALFNKTKQCVGFIVGCYVPSDKYQKTAECTTLDILIIEVNPLFRRQKIGHTIMTGILKFIDTHKISKCFLEVRIDNKAAINLYEKLGFKFNKVRKNYYRHKNKWVDALEYCYSKIA